MARAPFFLLLRSPSVHSISKTLCSGSWQRLDPSHGNPIANSSTQLATARRRWSSSPAATFEDESKSSNCPPCKGKESGQNKKSAEFVYSGPISSTIKKVKLLSLSTCCFSALLGPVIILVTSPEQNLILKGTVAFSIPFLSATTTCALNWFVGPYVHKLRWQPGWDSFEVEMMSWVAMCFTRQIKFADVRPPETSRPFVTFKANGKFYFVDEQNCHDKDLMARLNPEKATS